MNSAASSGKKLRIFHLEDDLLDADLLKVRLKGIDPPLSITTIASDEQWKSALNAGPPDLIISDSNIPGFDTKEAFAFARDHDPKIPVILYSGTIDPASHEQAKATGAYAFIDKSDASELVATIRKLLDNPVRNLPPADVPVIVQCSTFRCLACRTQAGQWVEFHRRKPLPEVISWAPI